MGLVGAFILPHGAMILNPKKKGIPKEAIELHKFMLKIVKNIEELKPDIVFLTTPHSIALSDEFGIYLNAKADGTAEWNGDYNKYSVEIDLDQDNSKKLYEYLLEKETTISGIAPFSLTTNVPLRWGEAVPLWFLRKLPTKPKYIIISQPLKRLEQAKDLIPETLTLGNDLRLFFESINKRIVVIISADLAHTHIEKGPYGYCDEAKPFDELIEKWAKTLTPELLTKKAIQKLNKVMCCGYIGFVMLQGMIEKMNFKPEVIIRNAPTYYGMMIVKYLK